MNEKCAACGASGVPMDERIVVNRGRIAVCADAESCARQFRAKPPPSEEPK